MGNYTYRCLIGVVEEFEKQYNASTKPDLPNGTYLFDTSKVAACEKLTDTERLDLFKPQVRPIGTNHFNLKPWDSNAKTIAFWKLNY